MMSKKERTRAEKRMATATHFEEGEPRAASVGEALYTTHRQGIEPSRLEFGFLFANIQGHLSGGGMLLGRFRVVIGFAKFF